MLAILWLTVWATVADAFYDDYNWYTSDDGVTDGKVFDPQKVVRENFSDVLRNFADSYISTREGDDVLTMAKVKSRLRMLKVFAHTDSSKDFEPSKGQVLPLREGARFCTMGRHTKVDCNHCTCVAGQLYMCTGMICPKPPAKPRAVITCEEGKRRKTDSCNYCYCRNGHEICSTRDCRLQHDHLLVRSKYTCHEGAHRKIDCNRCICRNGEEYCSRNKCAKKKPTLTKFKQDNQIPEGRCNDGQSLKIDCIVCKCTHNRWQCSDKNCVVLHKTENLLWAKCREGATRILDACNTCYCHLGREFCEKKDCDVEQHDVEYYRYLRYDEKQCEEGSFRKPDACNYCLCLDGTEVCTSRPCRDSYKDLLRRRKECDLWDVKYQKCNRCECHARRWVCTQKLCDGDTGHISESKGEVGLENSEKYFYLAVCNTGQERKLDCNACVCRGGQWYCQISVCDEHSPKATDLKGKNTIVDNNFEQLKTKESDNDMTKPPEDIDVAAKSSYSRITENSDYYDNTGLSLEFMDEFYEDSIFSSTEMDEPALMMGHPSCQSGTKKKIDACNNCHCRKGLWFCESKDCGPDIATLPKNCENGDKIIADCVPCTCRKRAWKCNIQKRKRNCTPNKRKEKEVLQSPEQALRMSYSHKDDTPKKCQIGQRYRIDLCNYCYCNSDRELVCSNNKCTYPQHIDAKYPLDITDERCKIGSRFRKGECNYCYCNYDRRLVCSNNKCHRKSSSAPKICLPHERFRIDACNWCYCNRTRQRVCQRNVCQPGQKPDDRWPPNSPRKGCYIGSRFARGKCGYCYCTVYRKISCLIRYNCTDDTTTTTRKPLIHVTTQRTRPRTSLNFECEVGQTQRIDDCNICRCTYSRKWICSDKVCPSNYARLDLSDEEKLLRFTPAPKICLPHERFRLDACNWCYCNRTRQRVCQRNVCQPGQKPDDSWPPNSPRKGCFIGSRFARGKCGYCYCSVYRRIECRIRYNCTDDTTTTTHKPLIRVTTGRSRPRNSLNYECEIGQIQRIDDCNFCQCTFSRKWMCSDNVCPSNDNNQPTIISEPKCLVGDPVPAPDPCNVCICVDSNILCTDNPCIQRQSEKNKNRKPTCVDGHKYRMDDGCNFCLCQGGQRFCTSRACLVPENVVSNSAGCNEGEVTPAEDRCNMCVCMNGKISCTNKYCSRTKLRAGIPESLLSYIRSQNNKKHRMTQGSKQKCIPGKTYFPDDFDPNCPNECICDRHELLCTKRKCFNNWDKQTPFKWPLGRVEKKSRYAKQLLNHNCVEYEKLPSHDPCISCMCLNGRKVCTIIACTDDNEGELSSDEALFIQKIQGSKSNKAKNTVKRNNTFCEPFTFFSPDNNRFCRNCFCLHNALALCLLNLCKYSKDIPHQNSPEELDEVCSPGETGYPTKCVTCTCSEHGNWICTREELALCQERDCDEKDEFHMGFAPYCAGCKCSVKEWFCSIQTETCRDFSNATCPLGTFIRNPKQHCSICLCGGYEAGSPNMCFTEAKCVRQVISQLKQ